MADITKINNGVADYDVRDAKAVHKTGEETIEGNKTFGGDLVSTGESVKGSAFAAVGMPRMTGRVAWTLPETSGGTITAPANGWFFITGTTTSDERSGAILAYSSINSGSDALFYKNGSSFRIFIPVLKNQDVRVYYPNVTVSEFYFLYANAEVA